MPDTNTDQQYRHPKRHLKYRIPRPPEHMLPVRFTLPKFAQGIVEPLAHALARIFFRKLIERSPQRSKLLGFRPAPVAGRKMGMEVEVRFIQRPSPVINKTCSGFFAVH